MALRNLINSIVFGENLNYREFIGGLWDNCSYNQKENIFEALVYLRSPRYGAGNEKLGMEIVNHLIEVDANFFMARLVKYAEKVSWKDIKRLLGRGYDDEIVQIWANQINTDLANLKRGKKNKITYAAKWFPTEGSKLDKSTKANAKACKHLMIKKDFFRKKYISPLRKAIEIPETHICEGNYENINYKMIPRRARSKYKKIFLEKDNERYLEYLSGRDWIWMPNSYWKPEDLPTFIPTTNSLKKKNQDILVMVDISPLMSCVIKKITLFFLREIDKRYNLHVCNYNSGDKIYKVEEGNLKFIYEKISETEAKKFKPPSDFLGSVIVLTTSHRKFNFIGYNVITWWSISHDPINVQNIEGVSYVTGYSKWVYDILATKIIINRDEVANLLMNSIGV